LLLDQRELPHSEVWLNLTNWREVEAAIRTMAVRGAPAIGIAAAYGVALAAKNKEDLLEAKQGLLSTRPTAVNLLWALEQMDTCADQSYEALEQRAMQLEAEEIDRNAAIGVLGSELISAGSGIMTICNTGSLATPGIGTALGVIRSAWTQQKLSRVFVLETRPRLQGLRLTSWELLKDGVPHQVIVDGAAAHFLAEGVVQCVVVGADRIAVNGDTANKIGTHALALQCHAYNVPFYVCAPTSTIDLNTPSGDTIPIEEREISEVTACEGRQIAPAGALVVNPAFDVTPHQFITAIVTEHAVHKAPFRWQ